MRLDKLRKAVKKSLGKPIKISSKELGRMVDEAFINSLREGGFFGIPGKDLIDMKGGTVAKKKVKKAKKAKKGKK